MLKLTHTDAADNIIFEVEYVLGIDGNRMQATEKRAGQSDVVWTYTYDELGRLTNETRTGSFARDVSYAYDADSNRLTEIDHENSDSTKAYAYYAGTQRLESITRDSLPYETYTWDDEQLATKTDQYGTVWTYVWDNYGRMTSANDDDGLFVGYAYDENDDLVRRRVFQDSVLVSDVKYLVDPNNLTGYSQVVAELDGQTGELLKVNTFADVLKAQSDVAASSTNFLHADPLGSIRSLTGAGATEDYNYTAFGSPLTGADGDRSLTNYAFTGQYRDADTTLQHHRARWLDTGLGRWASTDPVFDFPVNYANMYNYAGINPLRNVDLGGSLTLLDVLSSVKVMTILGFGAAGLGIGIWQAVRSDAGLWEGILIAALYTLAFAVAGVLMAYKPAAASVALVNGLYAAFKYEKQHKGKEDYHPLKTLWIFTVNFLASFVMALTGGRLTYPDLKLLPGLGVSLFIAALNAIVSTILNFSTFQAALS